MINRDYKDIPNLTDEERQELMTLDIRKLELYNKAVEKMTDICKKFPEPEKDLAVLKDNDQFDRFCTTVLLLAVQHPEAEFIAQIMDMKDIITAEAFNALPKPERRMVFGLINQILKESKLAHVARVNLPPGSQN